MLKDLPSPALLLPTPHPRGVSGKFMEELEGKDHLCFEYTYVGSWQK